MKLLLLEIYLDMYKNMTLADDLEFVYSTNSPSILVNEMIIAGK